MWKAALAFAVAFATLGSLSVSLDGIGITQAGAGELTITEAHIARLKNALKLTPTQEQHWRAVVVVLRAMVRSRGSDEEASAAPFVQRVRARFAGYVFNAEQLLRLSSAAQPLIASLDENQKQDGMMVIRSMGIASLP
jgi:hypothetical protein